MCGRLLPASIPLLADPAPAAPTLLHHIPLPVAALQDNTTVYVNRAPYVPYSGLVGVVSAAAEADRRQVSFDFLVFLADRNKELALSPNSETAGRVPDLLRGGVNGETWEQPSCGAGP